MKFYTTIQDFTGIYKEQPFMRELQSIDQDGISFMDCTQVNGTDCYCDDEAIGTLNAMMAKALAQQPSGIAVHFFDNGNYHYMSKLWTDRICEKFDLVIFDHHPDMQPPRFEGILSCGGWVKEVLDKNPNAQNILLIGVADHLIEELKNDEYSEFDKYKSRVQFITESDVCNGTTSNALTQWLRSRGTCTPLYISIDKDALCKADAATNWDQGSLTKVQLFEALKSLSQGQRILGIDICGERSQDCDYSEAAEDDRKNNELNKELFTFLQAL